MAGGATNISVKPRKILEQWLRARCPCCHVANSVNALKALKLLEARLQNTMNCRSTRRTCDENMVTLRWSAGLYQPGRYGAERSRWPWPQHEGTVSLERWHWPLTLWPCWLRQSSGHGQRHARTDQRVESADSHSGTKVRQSRACCFRHWSHHRLDTSNQHLFNNHLIPRHKQQVKHKSTKYKMWVKTNC